MTAPRNDSSPTSDFRRKAFLGLALSSLVILTPFAINNFIQGRHLLGVGSLAIIAILSFNGWSITRGRYYSTLTLVGLVPAVLFFLDLALRRQGIIGALWCYPALLSFYIMLPERQAWLANAALLVLAVPQAWTVLDHPITLRIGATLVAASIFAAIFIRVITRQQDKLQVLAVTDPLTGVFNRTLFRDTLDRAIELHRRAGTPMTLVAIDLDHFKAINDTLGHDAGDAVLRRVGELFRTRLRRLDRVFRLGGEEFLALLFDAETAQGRQVAEDLRATLASMPLLPDRQVTFSAGVSTLRAGEDRRAWLKRADALLYRAKAEGRNRVVL